MVESLTGGRRDNFGGGGGTGRDIIGGGGRGSDKFLQQHWHSSLGEPLSVNFLLFSLTTELCTSVHLRLHQF